MLFVPTGCFGERPSWIRDPRHPSWGERVLSAAELRDLVHLPLVALGAHSVTHRNLLTLTLPDAEEELARSKTDLETTTRQPVDGFSFPHGAYSEGLVAMARRLGYRRVFTIDPVIVHEHSAVVVGRVAADPGDWPLEFRLKLAGAYRWRQALRRLRMAV
jgi:peptidoglycan/xylan/chitin deacetylase (PgdA/CDA1 family)